MERPLRLITPSPLEALARTLEALLVVASQPLSVAELAEAADDDPSASSTALELLGERFREGRSGIVLEPVAGGYAFRASREAAGLRAPVRAPGRAGLSQAALETLAVVAYLGPCCGPEIARMRGVARRLGRRRPRRARPDHRGRAARGGGAVRYRTTPLFERVFGLESLSALPRLDDLGATPTRSATGSRRSPNAARPSPEPLRLWRSRLDPGGDPLRVRPDTGARMARAWSASSLPASTASTSLARTSSSSTLVDITVSFRRLPRQHPAHG